MSPEEINRLLVVPTEHLVERARKLCVMAREDHLEDLLADLQKLDTSAHAFLGLASELGNLGDPAFRDTGRLRHFRHQLRTPWNHILGYCALWLEEAEDRDLEAYRGDLQQMHALGKQILGQVEELLRPARSASPVPVVRRLSQGGSGEREQVVPAAAAARTPSILVVDDDEANRDVLGRWLRRDGHDVATAVSGRQALEMLGPRRFDLILLDLVMPEMDGMETLRQLKQDEQLKHLPVLMISASDEMDNIVRSIRVGAEDYLPKPFDPVLLQARVNACLEKKWLRDREMHYLGEIDKQRRRADEILHGILPAQVVQELKETHGVRPRRYENVAVLFGDVAGFTSYCDRNRPEVVVAHLQQLVTTWEEIAVRHQVEKIKTLGDGFLAAAGLLQQTQDHPVVHGVRCGLEMIEAIHQLDNGWDLRVGIHLGPVVAGVVGTRQYLFDIWGDTVNTAARIESQGEPGAVVLSEVAWQAIASRSRGRSLGVAPMKGKGTMDRFRFEGWLSEKGLSDRRDEG